MLSICRTLPCTAGQFTVPAFTDSYIYFPVMFPSLCRISSLLKWSSSSPEFPWPDSSPCDAFIQPLAVLLARIKIPHLPLVLLRVALEYDLPVVRVGVWAVVQSEDDGTGQQGTRRTAADHSAEHGLPITDRWPERDGDI